MEKSKKIELIIFIITSVFCLVGCQLVFDLHKHYTTTAYVDEVKESVEDDDRVIALGANTTVTVIEKTSTAMGGAYVKYSIRTRNDQVSNPSVNATLSLNSRDVWCRVVNPSFSFDSNLTFKNLSTITVNSRIMCNFAVK